MALQITNGIPQTAYAGETLQFYIDGDIYEPGVDACRIKFSHETGTNFFEVTGTDNGDGRWLFEVTEFSGSGVYRFYRYIEDITAAQQTVETGNIVIKAVPADGADIRSSVKKTLDALIATLEGKASRDQISYTFNNRSVSKLSPDELIKWRDYYQRLYDDEVAAEHRAAGVNPSVFKVEF